MNKATLNLKRFRKPFITKQRTIRRNIHLTHVLHTPRFPTLQHTQTSLLPDSRFCRLHYATVVVYDKGNQ